MPNEMRTFNPFRNKKELSQLLHRSITTNRVDQELPDNTIQTNKYTLSNFLPKNLLEQFSKKANLYFLFIGIMQTIQPISISEGIPIIFLPLAVIVVITAIKDFFEDYKRIISDQEENNRKILVMGPNGDFQNLSWSQIRVGNIIKVKKDEYVPADLVMLITSEPKGEGYIETKNLDGETNLKMKSTSPELNKIIINPQDIINSPIKINYQPPNPYLYRFVGTATYLKILQEEKVPMTIQNFILRGCALKNTTYVIGLVCYTGHDTKIMMNLFKPRSKKSSIEILMGKQILYIFIVQMLLCLFCSSYYLGWYEGNKQQFQNYLSILPSDSENSKVTNFFTRLGNWMLIFTNFVPISLLVTLEMVKFIQGLFMSKDKEMGQTEVQTSNLNEELGQIQYIFSDKTGTLTQNNMEFKQLLIGNQVYGKVKDTDQNYIRDYHYYPKVTNVDFRDERLINILKNPSDPEHERVKHFLFTLAICHTVITNFSEENETIYTATSPDEQALVNFAKFAGVEYYGLDQDNNVLIRFQQQIHVFKKLQLFEFDADRKRMSIIVQDKNNQIYLFCKGADSVIKQRADLSSYQYIEQLNQELEAFGDEGLRTLAISERLLTKEEYDRWKQEYHLAETTLIQREEKIKECQDQIEQKLVVLGATAIEDKLQRDVPRTIDKLLQAGIKIWVLTGDKIETAINIGFSCKLLDKTMHRFEVTETDQMQLEHSLNQIIEEMTQMSNSQTQQFALVINGEALNNIEIPHISLKIAKRCSSVICCRVSPKQKQQVVTLVRNHEQKCSTLAVGDGANDVNMITAAHVGVGIRGVEGQHAARASDYSIYEFRDLRRLLFCHGRECYRKNANLVLYNFFKNVLLVLPQFWYGITNQFSGQSLYDSVIYQLFNIFFTSLPIVIFAIFDEEFSHFTLFNNEKKNYYSLGINNQLFSTRKFWINFFFGTWQAAVIVYFAVYSIESGFVNKNGHVLFFWGTGTMVYGLIVVIANMKIIIISHTHSLGSLMVILGSLLVYLLCWGITSNFLSSELYLSFSNVMSAAYFHFGNVLTIIMTSFFEYAYHLFYKWQQNYNLQLKQEEQEKLEVKKKNPGLKSQMTQIVVDKQKQSKNLGFAFSHLDIQAQKDIIAKEDYQ